MDGAFLDGTHLEGLLRSSGDISKKGALKKFLAEILRRTKS